MPVLPDDNTRTFKLQRYTGIAIGLHWLIAALILGMLIAGKFMTGLDEASHLRFSLTQIHKSFGITLLLLTGIRIIWRLAHRAPPLPTELTRWERLAAGATHGFLYLLMLVLPLSGWIMVSSSPLNISTVLFNIIPFPHLPPFDTLANKAEIASLFQKIHEMASGILIALLLLHIGAALRHQIGLQDKVMSRMLPDMRQPQVRDGIGLFAGVLLTAVLGLFLIGKTITADADRSSTGLSVAGESTVNFTLVVMGDSLQGTFSESEIQFRLDQKDMESSAMSATVQTASGSTGSPQVDDSLPGQDWFDVANHPSANFLATSIIRSDDTTLDVTGKLTIRDITHPVSFTMQIDEIGRKARGGFSINRLDFRIGAVEQPDDTHAGYNVLIDFEFNIE